MSNIETGSETVELLSLDVGQLYQFVLSGVWAGATVTLEEWNAEASAYQPIKEFTEDGIHRRFIMGDRVRFVGTDVAGTTSIAIAHCLLKDSLLSMLFDESGKITEELLPDEIEVDSLGLSDISGLTLPAGSLGLDAAGKLMLSDGVTAGGNPVGGRRIEGSTHLTGVGAAGQFVEIGRVTIPVNQLVTPSNWRIMGRLNIYNDVSNWSHATLSPRVGLYQVGASSTALNRGYSMTWDYSQKNIVIDFALRFTISESGGWVTLAFNNSPGQIIMNGVASGVSTVTYPTLSQSIPGGARITPSGEDLVLALYGSMPMDDSGGDATGNVFFVSDLKLVKEG